MTSLPVKLNDSQNSLASLVEIANQLQRAEGMVPKHMIGNPGKILAAIMAGQELGVGPMASLRSFHVVEGKPCADYSFWVARLKVNGYKLEWLAKGAEKVTLRLTAPDGMTHTETWDKDRAVRAGLWNGKDNWKKYPETMLCARCVTSAGRTFAAEVMFGCYETDEAEEIRTVAATDVTPATAQHVASITEAVGAAPPPEHEQQRLQRAHMLAECMKQAGLTRIQVDEAMQECDVPRGRIGALAVEHLQRLEEWLAKKQAADDRAENAHTEGVA